MATEKQIDFIEVMMQQAGVGRRDLAAQKKEWGRYERLSTREVDLLLRWLRGEEEQDDGERPTAEVSDAHVWAVIKAVLAERGQLRESADAAARDYADAQADTQRLSAALKWLAHDYALHSFDEASRAVRWLHGNDDDEIHVTVYNVLRDKTDELRGAREVSSV